MDSRTSLYAALAISVVALLVAVYAVWQAGAQSQRIDDVSARVDQVQQATPDHTAEFEALSSEVREALEELAGRIEEVDGRVGQLEQAPPPAQPTPDQPAPQAQ